MFFHTSFLDNYASNTEDFPVAKTVGRSTVLKPEDEKVMVDWVRTLASVGFPITNKELLDSIQHSLNLANRKTTFKNNRTTMQWAPKFRKRHNLSLRIPETQNGFRAWDQGNKPLLILFQDIISIFVFINLNFKYLVTMLIIKANIFFRIPTLC